MELTKFFLDLLEREYIANRKVLERVPQDIKGFKPHPKSMEMGYLTVLVAQMPAWIEMILTTEELNIDPGNSESKFQKDPAESNEALLKLAEESYQKAKRALNEASEDQLNVEWTVKMKGKPISSGKRYQQIADAFTHLAHHRGQLTVYLQLKDAKLPAIYGPSADEFPS